MNDTENIALDALVVRNMAQLNKALSRIRYGIYPVAFGAVTDSAGKWVGAQGWIGEFDYDGVSGEFWCAPPTWRLPGGERRQDCYAYFEFDFYQGRFGTEDGDQDDIVTLLGAGVGAMGFNIVRGDCAQISKGPWKRLMQASDIVGTMQSLGFKQYEGSYFLPIPFNAEALAVAIEQGDMSTFLTPLREALDRLPDAVSAMRPVIEATSGAGGEAAYVSRVTEKQ